MYIFIYIYTYDWLKNPLARVKQPPDKRCIAVLKFFSNFLLIINYSRFMLKNNFDS